MFAALFRAAIATAVTTCTLSGCGGSGDPEAAEQVRLTMTTYDAAETPGGALVEHFLNQVARLDPSIRITPRYEDAPSEPDAVSQVSDGGADLAMVASRAFDTAGVTTLQALNAPFLIDSMALANAVATGQDVDELMAGLEDIDVIGLAVVPAGMRHLFGDEKAPVDVSDMRGVTVRSPQSEAVWSFLAALGATPIFDDSRDYAMTESAFDLDPLGHVAGNVTLFPKYNVIAVNQESARSLSPTQMDALRTAATESMKWAIATTPSDASMAHEFCARNGEIRAATPAQLEEWLAMADPVIEQLRSTPSTAALIDRVTAMKSHIEAEQPVTGCELSDGGTPTVSPLLNGTYRYTATADAFRRVGIHDQTFIDMNAGEYTIKMKDGELEMTQRFTSGPQAGQTESGTSTYTLEGDELTFRWSTKPGDFTQVEVAVLPDGSLKFSEWVEGLPEPKFLLQDKVTLRRWERISLSLTPIVGPRPSRH